MSHFIFKARKTSGEEYSAERDAADRFELYRIIREGGDELVSLKESRTGSLGPIFESFKLIFSPIKMSEKINVVRNLGSMLEAGLALSRALMVLEHQSRNRRLKQVLSGIISDINRGTTFTEALAKYPKVFPPLVVSMVHAGEQSGTMAQSLKVVATQMENMHSLEKRIRGALIYPIVIVCLMLVVGIVMFIFVVPVLIKTFEDLHAQLPVSTQIIIGISNLIKDHGIILLLGFLLASAALYTWSHSPRGRSMMHALVLKIPVIGSLVQEVNSARTARTLASLLGAGVDAVEAVNISREVIQNVHFKLVLAKAAAAIKNGEPVSKVFNQYTKLYPLFFAEMISVGEETGKMGDMLLGVAKYYEEDVDQKTKDLSTIIEPALMIVVGVAVGFFAVSMISPMYSLVNAI